MIADYIDYILEHRNDEDFSKKAIDKLQKEVPDENEHFAEKLFKLLMDEEYKLGDGAYYNRLAHKAYKGGKELRLTPTEIVIIEAIIRAGMTDYDALIRDVWGYGEDISILRVNIQNIRRKIGKDAIKNIKGYGYKI